LQVPTLKQKNILIWSKEIKTTYLTCISLEIGILLSVPVNTLKIEILKLSKAFIIGKLDIFPLMCAADEVWIT
jgi:hypothetical protein